MSKFNVRCIKTCDGRFIKGKVYSVEDNGQIFDEDGGGSCPNTAKSFEAWHRDCKWSRYAFELVTSNTYELHITCNDGKTTNAVYKVNGKIEKRTEAVCAPSDTFDFAIGAQTAFDRVFPSAQSTQPIAPQGEKAKYAVGDRVIATDNVKHFIKKPATILAIDKSKTPFQVKFDKDGLVMWCYSEDIEPYAEPEQPKSKYDSMSNDELKRLACGISELCCPTLSNKKRKSVCPLFHTRCEVTGENRAEIIQYLIDEETPEPEKEPEPVYYSGKVVCVKTDGDGTFTVGKVYEFVDGQATDNEGTVRPSCVNIKSLDDDYMKCWYYRFIPFLGE